MAVFKNREITIADEPVKVDGVLCVVRFGQSSEGSMILLAPQTAIQAASHWIASDPV